MSENVLLAIHAPDYDVPYLEGSLNEEYLTHEYYTEEPDLTESYVYAHLVPYLKRPDVKSSVVVYDSFDDYESTDEFHCESLEHHKALLTYPWLTSGDVEVMVITAHETGSGRRSVHTAFYCRTLGCYYKYKVLYM